MRILVHGSRGRMGRTVIACVREAGHEVVAEVDEGDDLAAGLARAETVIDFSFHTATNGLLDAACERGVPLVIGTTGHPAEEKSRLLEMARRVPCVWAGNFSIGVNLLFHLVETAGKILPEDYDIEVTEMHHRLKKDAPSGTAARLLEILLEARRLAASAVRHGRSGITGERPDDEIGMHTLRGGDVVGDHTVLFAAPGERLELTHRASDRAIFARGAVRAAEWLAGKPAGVYDMQDVLGFR